MFFLLVLMMNTLVSQDQNFLVLKLKYIIILF